MPAGRSRTKALLAALTALGGLAGGSLPAVAAEAPTQRVVVTFTSSAARAASGVGAKASANVLASRSLTVDLRPSEIADLRLQPGVQAVEENTIFKAAVTPNDPCLTSCSTANGTTNQWGPAKIGLPAAWDLSTGVGQRIAILDTGIDASHPDLSGRIEGGENAMDIAADGPNDHGTASAGIAGAIANNGIGTAGVAFGSKLIAIQVLASVDHPQSGTPSHTCGVETVRNGRAVRQYPGDLCEGEGSLDWVVRGVNIASNVGADVISMSLTSPTPSTALKAAIDDAAAKGAVVAAAAGNFNAGEDRTAPQYPASFANVISVGATDRNDKVASFSANGKNVDVYAPGVDIVAPAVGTGYQRISGTSEATPHVAGIAALLRAREPGLGVNDVRLRLLESSLSLNGFPRVDVAAAVRTFDPYGRFAGGSFVAGSGNLVGGGTWLTGAGAGGGPHVRIANLDGSPHGGGFFAYDSGFVGGVRVAAERDHATASIAYTAPGPGGGPNVRAFNPANGNLLRSFNAYDPAFSGGVRIAVGSLGLESSQTATTPDRNQQIVTSPGPGVGPNVRVFSSDGSNTLLRSFFSYAPGFVGGVTVAVCQSSAGPRIVTGAGPGGGPHVNILNADGQSLGGGFFAFDRNFHGGVTVACADIRPDLPGDEIIVGAGPGGGPNVRVFAADANGPGGYTLIASLFAFNSDVTGGVEVAGTGTHWAGALTRLANGVRILG